MTTLDYYGINASLYSARTLEADLSDIYSRFTACLDKGMSILDLGCGSGRDSLYFRSLGFDVTAADGCEEMCRIAGQNTGLKVRKLCFDELDYASAFDAVWACSSLLHVPSVRLEAVFRLIHRALKPEGVFYSSFKYGSFEGERDGRYFTNLTEKSFSAFCTGLFAPADIWISGDVCPGRENVKWLNAIVRKLN